MLETVTKFAGMLFEIFVSAIWRLAWSLVLFILVIMFIITACVAALVQVTH